MNIKVPFRTTVTLLLSMVLIQQARSVEAISNLAFGLPGPEIGDIHDLFPGDISSVMFQTGPTACSINSVTIEEIIWYPGYGDTVFLQIYKLDFFSPPLPDALVGQLSAHQVDPTP